MIGLRAELMGRTNTDSHRYTLAVNKEFGHLRVNTIAVHQEEGNVIKHLA